MASAATFSGSGGTGDFTVGSGGDYTSLNAAASDFSGSGQAVTGPVRFLISSDLTETANSYFGKATAGFTVTIKPADGVTPTVTFTKTNDNGGASGNLIIGASADNTNWGAALVKTDGVVVDGSNNLGVRQLTLTTLTSITHSFQSLVTVVGDSDNVQIKNAKLLQVNTGGGSSIGCIRIASRQQTIAPAGTWVPDGFQITNNELVANNGTQGVAVNMTGSGTVAAGTGNSNWVVNDNTISARIRGVFISQGLAGASVTGNDIKIGTTAGVSGFAHAAIHVNSANTPPANTFTVANNKAYVVSANTATGANGPSGFILGSMGSGSDRICNVYNNMINFSLTGTNANTAQVYRGIWSSSGITYRYFNNSINMPANTNATMNSLTCFGIGGWTAASPPELYIQNNIIRVAQANTVGIMKDHTGVPTTLVSNNNVITPSGGAGFGRWLSTVHATRSAWNTASGLDANSNDTFDPLTSLGSNWAPSSNADLHFVPNTNLPQGLPGYAAVTVPFAVAADIDGDDRTGNSPKSYAGADEISGVPVPVNLSGFQLD